MAAVHMCTESPAYTSEQHKQSAHFCITYNAKTRAYQKWREQLHPEQALMCVGETSEEPAAVHAQLPMHVWQLPQPPGQACGCTKQGTTLPVSTQLRIQGDSNHIHAKKQCKIHDMEGCCATVSTCHLHAVCSPSTTCCLGGIYKLHAMLAGLREPGNCRKMHVLPQKHGRAAPVAEQMQEPQFAELLLELFLATPGQMHLD